MFLVDMQFLRPLEDIPIHITAHRKHLARHYATGTLLLGGEGASQWRPHSVAACQPEQKSRPCSTWTRSSRWSAANYTMTEFQPVMMQEELRPWFS